MSPFTCILITYIEKSQLQLFVLTGPSIILDRLADRPGPAVVVMVVLLAAQHGRLWLTRKLTAKQSIWANTLVIH